ncbi:MAG: hypothetical protein JW904_01035 [Spirochaetales bacterium]|nr:hypothetical protein [Spirochaetales bacterium]
MQDTFENKLKELTDDQLIDIVINYKKYHYPDDSPDIAMTILKKRTVPKEKIELLAEKYIVEKQEIKYEKQELSTLLKDYVKYAVFTYIFVVTNYLLIIFLPVLFFLVFEPVAIIIAFAIFIITYIFYALTINKYIIFRSIADGMNVNKLINFFYYAIGYAVSPIVLIYNYFQMKKAIKELEKDY